MVAFISARLQVLVDRGVELADDIGRRAGGRQHAGPEIERELAEPDLGHGRHVGQAGLRAALVMASARILPSRMSGSEVAGVGR